MSILFWLDVNVWKEGNCVDSVEEGLFYPHSQLSMCGILSVVECPIIGNFCIKLYLSLNLTSEQ